MLLDPIRDFWDTVGPYFGIGLAAVSLLLGGGVELLERKERGFHPTRLIAFGLVLFPAISVLSFLTVTIGLQLTGTNYGFLQNFASISAAVMFFAACILVARPLFKDKSVRGVDIPMSALVALLFGFTFSALIALVRWWVAQF
jgi:hypothetical protein